VIGLRCVWCGWSGVVADDPDDAEVLAWVSREVGHPMLTLEQAAEHICCPGCDQTTLRLQREAHPPVAKRRRGPL